MDGTAAFIVALATFLSALGAFIQGLRNHGATADLHNEVRLPSTTASDPNHKTTGSAVEQLLQSLQFLLADPNVMHALADAVAVRQSADKPLPPLIPQPPPAPSPPPAPPATPQNPNA